MIYSLKNGIHYLKSNAVTFSIREVRNCCTIVEKSSQKNTNIALFLKTVCITKPANN